MSRVVITLTQAEASDRVSVDITFDPPVRRGENPETHHFADVALRAIVDAAKGAVDHEFHLR